MGHNSADMVSVGVETGVIRKLRVSAFQLRQFQPQRNHISRVMAHLKWDTNLDIDSIFPMEIEFLKICCYLLWHPRNSTHPGNRQTRLAPIRDWTRTGQWLDASWLMATMARLA